MRNVISWKEYFIEMAHFVSTRSKDPSTQVGAVIVKNKRIVSCGYNGMPEGVKETAEMWERPLKYTLVIHAEDNAIQNAIKMWGDSARATMNDSEIYVTHMPCMRCSNLIIDAGIKKVYWSQQVFSMRANDVSLSIEYLNANGVTVERI